MRTDVESLAQKAMGSRALCGMFLPLPRDEDHPDMVVVASVFLVYVRSGGFMVVVPPDENVRLALAHLEDPSAELPVALQAGEIALETARGRAVGEGAVELVDLPWDAVGGFVATTSLRGAALREARVISFRAGAGDLGGLRPVKEAAHGLADAWILEGMDDEAAQDYVTGEELSDQELQPAAPPGSVVPEEMNNEVLRLRQRVAELEAAAQARTQKSVYTAAPKPQPKAGPFFAPTGPQESATLTTEDWSKLQMLAGSPPPRVGAGEKRRGKVPNIVNELEGAFANREKEAEEPDEVPNLLEVIKQDSADPVHRLLAVQLQQNQALLERLVGQKPADPVLGILAGGEGSSGSSSGVKGCLARDAFIKAINDLPKVVRVTRSQALKELGMGADREDGSILRRYMERKVPLADHRLLSCIHGCHAGRVLVGGLSVSKRGVVGHDSQDVLLRRTVCDRRGKMPGCLATDWISRAGLPPFDQPETSDGATTVCSSLCPSMDCCEHIVCEGPGLYGEPYAKSGKAGKTTTNGRGSRSTKRSPSEEAAEGKRQEEQGSSDGRGIAVDGRGNRSPGWAPSSLHGASDNKPVFSSFDNHDDPDTLPLPNDKSNRLPDLRANPTTIDPVGLAMQFCNQFWHSRTALTSFARACVAEPSARTVQEGNHNPLWPVPIPRFSWTAYKRLSPRRRLRRKFLETRHRLLVISVFALNFQALGFVKKPPPGACLGAHISPGQHRILERLEDMISHFLQMAPFESGDLGRSREKFETLIGIEKLPLCQSDDFDFLSEMLESVHVSLDPYGSHFGVQRKPEEAMEKSHDCQLEPRSIVSKGLAVGSKPVEADRVKWENPPFLMLRRFWII